jgi:UDP-4-amino-4,6-dideoxy-N-acetyl-beta-L-altrosamine N-acetyltransferase
MTEADLPVVLSWRNHPEIRRFMYTQHEISQEEHLRWFAEASGAADRRLFIFEVDESPLGFVSLSVARDRQSAKWGFYVAPGAPKGSGRSLGQAAVYHAFSTLRLHKLCGEALSHNERSIRLHRHLGFKEEGILREQHFDGDAYRDIICFGLLSREWLKSPLESQEP